MSDTPTHPAGIDGPQVTEWFRVNVPDARPPLSFSRITGGHSCLTYIVTDAADQRYVLRRPPLGHVLATAHDVAREHRIMSALAGTGMPVPTMLGLCQDDTVNEAPFYVMTYVPGVVLHDSSDVADALPDVESRRRASESMVDALVTLHGVDIDAVGLGDLARRSGYLERQLKRWSSQWEQSKTRELPSIERLYAWLIENKPEEFAGGIVHGDFRLGNTLLGPDGTVQAVLDWELCTLGDPMADVSYLIRSWTQPEDPAGPRAEPPTRVGGFYTREEMAERYAERSGRDLGDLGYWMAFNAWRSAAIAEGVYRRYVDGNMGDRPEDLDQYALGVEASVDAGLEAAGIA
jgi:aminoglycoside phosphotransferase (APT) family kinase protein